jgi:hypothetical protein
MAKGEMQYQQIMNRALDEDLTEQEMEQLGTRLEESADDAVHWERLRQTDELLRITPMVAPAAGFTNRVMAAIAAMPLPDFAKRHLSVGIALGLAIVALLTVPILSVIFLDPGALNDWLQTLINAAGYVINLLGDLAGEVRDAGRQTPMLLALLTTMIPLTVLWGWLIWYLLGGPKFMTRRQKS